jgi:hypothetical protein
MRPSGWIIVSTTTSVDDLPRLERLKHVSITWFCDSGAKALFSGGTVFAGLKARASTQSTAIHFWNKL